MDSQCWQSLDKFAIFVSFREVMKCFLKAEIVKFWLLLSDITHIDFRLLNLTFSLKWTIFGHFRFQFAPKLKEGELK